MTIKELLKQEKGKYDKVIPYYQKYKKFMPFAFSDRNDFNDMNVIDYFYQEKQFKSVNIKNKTMTNDKPIKCLIIVWNKK